MRVQFVLGAGVVTATLALSACGGGGSSPPSPSPNSTGSFTTAFKSVTGEFGRGSQVIATEIGGAASQTDAQLAVAFKTLATKWQAALSKLETLTPPSSVQPEFNTLKDAATRAEDDLNAIVSAAQNHDASAAKQASTSLVNDIQSAKTAAQSIDQKLGTS
jgi:hypothetical protein